MGFFFLPFFRELGRKEEHIMSYVIKAVLHNAQHPECGQITIPFPIPNDQYDEILEKLQAMYAGFSVKLDCTVDEADSWYGVLSALKGQPVNVDQLDYLAKRLEGFDGDEASRFQAMADKLKLADIKDFINLTFCCQQVTVISDFSDLEQVGKDHALTISGGSMPMETFQKIDGQTAALNLIQSCAGVVTPYGVVYDNGMKLEPLYDGRHFPAYLYGPPQLAIEIRSGQNGEAAGFLCLPCPARQIQRTMQRAGTGNQGFQMEINMYDLPPQVSAVISLTRDSLDDLNALCRAIEPMDPAERKKLEAVVMLAQPEYASEVCQLAENLDQFDFMPKPDSPEADSALTELGYVTYHGSLALDELMQDDPTEQHQQMGGMM